MEKVFLTIWLSDFKCIVVHKKCEIPLESNVENIFIDFPEPISNEEKKPKKNISIFEQ